MPPSELNPLQPAMQRLAIFGVVLPALFNVALCGVLMLVPRTPVIVFQAGWILFTIVALVCLVVVLIRGDRKSRIIASIGGGLLLLFFGFIVLVVLAIRAAFST